MIAQIDRRQFLKAGSLAATRAALLPAGLSAADNRRGECADVNVTLGRWPFRRLPLDDTRALVARLRHHGVRQAWAGSFEALLHGDVEGVNARLVEECRRHGGGLLLPFGAVNLSLPDWEEDLRRCHERHDMPGIRLHPNYHGYELDNPAFAKCLRLATERGLIIQIALSMDDPRMQNRLVPVPDVDAGPLRALAKSSPARLVLLNWFRSVKMDLARALAEAGVYFDIATLEGAGGVSNFIGQVPLSRVLFGSHAPFFYFDAAGLKLQESPLSAEQLRAIRGTNARRLLGGK